MDHDFHEEMGGRLSPAVYRSGIQDGGAVYIIMPIFLTLELLMCRSALLN